MHMHYIFDSGASYDLILVHHAYSELCEQSTIVMMTKLQHNRLVHLDSFTFVV